MPDSEYIRCADTAKLLRASLRSAFPGVKFSVRSKTYSGGASIDVAWTDGPLEADVDAIAQLYRGATFDGMQDLKEYHSTILATPEGDVKVVHFGADFVFTHRNVSPGFVARRRADRNGRSDGRDQCRYCQRLIPAGPSWTATLKEPRHASRGVVFACTEEHAQLLAARYVRGVTV